MVVQQTRLHCPRLPAFLLLVALCWLTSCGGDGNLSDERNPFYIKGKRLGQEEKYEESAQAFEKCLRLSPYSYKAHLQLAMLYEDRLKDPLQSVYHYRAYLQKAPKEEDVGIVHKWLARAERTTMLNLADKYPEEMETVVGNQPANPANGLTPREQILLDRLKQASAQIQQLRETVSRLEHAPTPPAPVAATSPAPVAVPTLPVQTPLDQLSPVADAAPSSPATPAPVAVPPPVVPPVARAVPAPATAPSAPVHRAASRPTSEGAPVAHPVLRRESAATPPMPLHKVQSGDTLSSLARRYYGNANLWTKIRDKNRAALNGGTTLKVGMTLRIPPQ